MAETQARAKCEDEIANLHSQLEERICRYEPSQRMNEQYMEMKSKEQRSELDSTFPRMHSMKQVEGNTTPGFASSRERASLEYKQGDSQINKQELEWEIADIIREKEAQLIQQYETKIERIKEIASSELVNKTAALKEEIDQMKVLIQKKGMEVANLQYLLSSDAKKTEELRSDYHRRCELLDARCKELVSEVDFYKEKLEAKVRELEKIQVESRRVELDRSSLEDKLKELAITIKEKNNEEVMTKKILEEHIKKLEDELINEKQRAKILKREASLYEDDMLKRKQEMIELLQSIDLESIKKARLDTDGKLKVSESNSIGKQRDICKTSINT
jgi:hypothetical protein